MTDKVDEILLDLKKVLKEYEQETRKIKESIPLLPECKNTEDVDIESFKKGQLSVMVYLSDLLGISLVFYDLRKGFQETIKTLVMLQMELKEQANLHKRV